jgi:splicing factor 3A subunit 1
LLITVAYACIDWHDFVVVETVDYQPFESGNFPPPTTPQEVGARVLLQDRILSGQIEKGAPDDSFAAQDDTEVCNYSLILHNLNSNCKI